MDDDGVVVSGSARMIGILSDGTPAAIEVCFPGTEIVGTLLNGYAPTTRAKLPAPFLLRPASAAGERRGV